MHALVVVVGFGMEGTYCVYFINDGHINPFMPVALKTTWRILSHISQAKIISKKNLKEN